MRRFRVVASLVAAAVLAVAATAAFVAASESGRASSPADGVASPSAPVPAAGAGNATTSYASAASDRAGPASFALVDDVGRTVVLGRAPTRIVSLAPHATELLFAVGAGGQVIAVDPYSDEPAPARALPRVAGYPQLDVEGLLALAADLVVLWGPGVSRAQLERLESLRVPVFVSHPRTLGDIASTLRRFARLAPDPAIGAAAADAFEARLASIRERYAQRRPVRVFVQIWSSPLVTVSDADPIGDALRSCGGVNVFGDVGVVAPQPGAETVLARRPELIVATDPSPSARRWADLGLLEPKGPARFVAFDASRFERPGPRSLDALQRLCETIDEVRSRPPGSR